MTQQEKDDCVDHLERQATVMLVHMILFGVFLALYTAVCILAFVAGGTLVGAWVVHILMMATLILLRRPGSKERY